MPKMLSTIKVLAYNLNAKNTEVLIRRLLLINGFNVIIINSLCGCLRHPKLAPAFDIRGRGEVRVRNNKFLEGQVLGWTPVRNDKDLVIQIFHEKIFFAQIVSKYFRNIGLVIRK